MGSASVRRSSRRGAANRKYTEDAFEAAGLSEDSSVAGTPSKPARERINDSSDITDHEFVLREDDDVEMEPPPDEESYATDGTQELEQCESFSDESIGGSSDPGDEEGPVLLDDSPNKGKDLPPLRRQKPRRENTRLLGVRRPHYRGVWNPQDRVAKRLHYRLTFGAHLSDRLSFTYTRDRWAGPTDVTFPSRRSLGREYTMSNYGVGRTFGVDEEHIANESTKGWDWYYEGTSGKGFRERQQLESIEADEASRAYIPKPRNARHTIFMGPLESQKGYELGPGDSFNFGDAWDSVRPGKKGPQQVDREGMEEINGQIPQENISTDPLPASEAESPPGQKVREGWILNIGQKVNCLDWAPNQEGNTQFLAISALAERTVLTEDSEDELENAPAFTPSQPSPASIQIWSFEAGDDDERIKGLDMRSAPILRAVICTDWGDVRRFSWCPMSREKRDGESNGTINLGLLAGIWGDGSVRVLDVQLKKDREGPEYLRFKTSCFAARPPSTVCTCMTWLSPSDIAVGCANGFVAVWSLATSHTDSPQLNPKPYIYIPVHSTYILSLVSAYPNHPHFLATTSMDGLTRMFSLLDPQKDTVDSSRMRNGPPHLIYSPHLRAFVCTDENDFFRLLSVRRFFSTVLAGKSPSPLSTFANSSRWHPTVLGGGTNGSAIVTNPFRSLTSTRELHYQQNWFIHEWTSAKVGSDGGKSRPEASRFIEGFKAEHTSLVRNMIGDDKVINGVLTTTIYDEPGHVTALAWNPNHSFSGWACAGLGCGLVRVEDIAI